MGGGSPGGGSTDGGNGSGPGGGGGPDPGNRPQYTLPDYEAFQKVNGTLAFDDAFKSVWDACDDDETDQRRITACQDAAVAAFNAIRVRVLEPNEVSSHDPPCSAVWKHDRGGDYLGINTAGCESEQLEDVDTDVGPPEEPPPPVEPPPVEPPPPEDPELD